MEYSQDLFWNNIRYPKNRIHKKLGYLERTLLTSSFLKNLKNPYFIWTGTGRIVPLEEKILDSKVKNTLKNSEFYFYIYEPLCARIDNYNKSFYSEFNSTENIRDIVSDELESIRIFVKNNDIKKFRVFTTDYNINLLENNYPDINLNCLDLFIRETAPCYYQHPDLKNNITKKFWCGNWRYTTHRHLVASYLATLDGTYTWNLKCSYDELEKNYWFNLNDFKIQSPDQYNQLKQGVEILYNTVLSIDSNIEAVNVTNADDVFIPGHSAPARNLTFLKTYRECFCAVVNETRFAQPFGNFSEKTLNAIFSKIPFILVAPPYTLEYLKKLGFKTFDKWWNEDYDLEENHHNRIIKIFNIIDYINSKTIEELKVIYNEMKEILDHNEEILNTIAYNNTPL